MRCWIQIERQRAELAILQCRQVLRRGLPVAGTDVRMHLLRLRRARDYGRDRRLRRESADCDVEQRHASLLGEALEGLDVVERLIGEDTVASAQACPFRSRLIALVLSG